MSTKTAFKRVALVAAAALAIGGISAVSANAVIYSESLAISTTASSITAGATATAVVTDVFLPDTSTSQATTATAYLISSPVGNSVLPTVGVTSAQIAANALTNSVQSGTGQVSTVTATAGSLATTANYNVNLVGPTVPGTYVVKIIPANTNANSLVWTVTVAALAPITAASSTLTSTPTTITGPKAATGISVGSVVISANNATANATAAVLSATVSGPGLVSFASFVSAGRAVSQAALNTGTLQVYADGTAGVGTITISSGTTVLGTVTATFYGTPVKYTVTALKPVIVVGAAAADAISVSAVDINNAAVPLAGFGTLTLTSDATSSITSAMTVADTISTGCSVTVVCYTITSGATAGTANLTVTDTTNTLSAAPVAVRASSGVPTTVTFTTDAAAYPAGGVGTLTVTVGDAVGPLPAGTYLALFTGQATSSLALVTGTLPGCPNAPSACNGNITVGSAGTATVTFNAPLSDGTATITATPTATTVTVTPASFTVTSGSSDAANAATDAANEATDAANAATDAANAAADSADAATVAAQDASAQAAAALLAVQALQQQVTSILAKIAGLAASLARVIKKVKA